MKQIEEMGLEDLYDWYLNYSSRWGIAEELSCSGNDSIAGTCCIVHQGFEREKEQMVETALRIYSGEVDGAILSPNWWTEARRAQKKEAVHSA